MNCLNHNKIITFGAQYSENFSANLKKLNYPPYPPPPPPGRDQILEGRRSQEEIIFNNTTFQIWSIIVLPSFHANKI